MSGWYKTLRYASKEEFLLRQKPKQYSVEDWSKVVKWALEISQKHAIWITNLLRRNPQEFIFGEDDNKLRESLELFDKARRKRDFPKKDINQFKSYEELTRTLEPYREVKTKKEVKEEALEGGLKLIDTVEGFSLIKLLTYEGAHAVAQGTDWCVTHKGSYDNYNSMGPIHYISKGDNKYGLLHPPTNQLKNTYDGRMAKASIIPILPLLEKHKEYLGIEKYFDLGVTPEVDPQAGTIYGNDLRNITEAIKDLTVLKNQLKGLDAKGFMGSEPVLKIMRAMKEQEGDGVSEGLRRQIDKGIWADLEMFFAVKDHIPKGGLEALLKLYVNFFVKEVKDDFDENLHAAGFRFDGNGVVVEIENTFFGKNIWEPLKHIKVELTERTLDYQALPIEMSREQDILAVMDYINQESIDAVVAVMRSDAMTNIADNYAVTDSILDVYNSIDERLKNAKLAAKAKAIIDETTEKMYTYNEEGLREGGWKLNDTLKINIDDKVPEELTNDYIKKGSIDAWRTVIREMPESYESGVVRSGRYEDKEFKVPDESDKLNEKRAYYMSKDVQKALRGEVEEMFRNMASQDSTYSHSNLLSEKIAETSGGYLNHIPQTLYQDPVIEQAIIDATNHTIENYNGSYVISFLSNIKKGMMTPKILQATQDGLVRFIENVGVPIFFDYVSEETNPEAAANFLKMPVVRNKILEEYRKPLDEDQLTSITLIHPRNKEPDNYENKINVKYVPDFVRGDSQFQKNLTESILNLLVAKERVNANTSSDYHYNQIYNADLVANGVPDYVAADPRFERAKQINLYNLYKKNVIHLLYTKVETPKEVEKLRGRIADLEQMLSGETKKLDPDDIKALKGALEKRNEELKSKLENMGKADTPRTNRLWSNKVLKMFEELIDQESSIFDDSNVFNTTSYNRTDPSIRQQVENMFDEQVFKFPEFLQKLYQVYEKDKELIDAWTFRFIKHRYKKLEGTDLKQRILGVVQEIIQSDFLAKKAILDEWANAYANVLIPAITEFYSQDTGSRGRHARPVGWRIQDEINNLRSLSRDKVKQIEKQNGDSINKLLNFYNTMNTRDKQENVKKAMNEYRDILREQVRVQYYDKYFMGHQFEQEFNFLVQLNHDLNEIYGRIF